MVMKKMLLRSLTVLALALAGSATLSLASSMAGLTVSSAQAAGWTMDPNGGAP
jgi:hypothetical protein